MNIRKIITFTILLFLVSNVFALSEVSAAKHELESLDIHVFINEDGSATITEKRVATLSEGTENYIVIGNLGKSTIKDFKVFENGKEYEYVDPWDINKSREEKTFKNGIIKRQWHYELSWGIGEYGKHEYEITYTITDFIKQLTDSQMLFWQFVNPDMNIPPQQVTVTIETNEPITEENGRIWAFGFEGEINFLDGKVVAESEKPLKRSNYVTILIQFPNGNFGTNDILDQTFEQIKETAFLGSDYYEDNTLSYIITALVIGAGLAIIIVIGRKIIKKYKKKKRYEGRYYREVPYDGEFYHAYGPLRELRLSKLNNVISAFILKWVKEERIAVVPTTKKGLFKNKEVAELHIIDGEIDNSRDAETQLFRYFKRAAKNGVIKQNSFRNWASNNYELMLNWKIKLEETSFKKFEKEGYLTRKKKKTIGIKYLKNDYTPKMQEFEDNVNMFINYLKDYSLLNEHEPVNVKIWDDLMIWAALLGITDEVYEQFKQLYPEYEKQSNFSDITIQTAVVYSSTMNTAIHSARTGGSGGSSSIGGGGGSFGGGSGGGTR